MSGDLDKPWASLCPAPVRTILHGPAMTARRRLAGWGPLHPVAETFRRTIEWAVAEGLVTRPLPRASN